MTSCFRRCFAAVSAAFLLVPLARAEDTLTVEYPASDRPGELAVPSTFHVWLPPGAERIRAVIVHQHGCGDGAENSGETAALDLQWRALAARHGAALLSPHYHAGDRAECRLWCDPRNGSGDAFVRALRDLEAKSGRPGLATAPWCLWGHSGGGFWASLMLARSPERIVAVFCRSGAATVAWQKHEIPGPDFPPASFGVPVALNPGVGERDDARFRGAWDTTSAFFALLRAQGAPAVFAPDPFSGHDCRNSRLFAVPFFDACLRLRLPRSGNALKPLDPRRAWSGDWATATIGAGGKVAPGLSLLPDRRTADAFAEYVKTGKTTDRTRPADGAVLTSVTQGPDGVALEWTAKADLESGVRQFVIYRDGALVARIPEKPDDRTGFAQYQGLTYHDTPRPEPPALRFVDTNAPADRRPRYSVSMVNGSGLEGPRGRSKKAPSAR